MRLRDSTKNKKGQSEYAWVETESNDLILLFGLLAPIVYKNLLFIPVVYLKKLLILKMAQLFNLVLENKYMVSTLASEVGRPPNKSA